MSTLLNGLTPQAFLTAYWQKKPLLVRQAIPDFAGFLSPEELAGLACEESVESRIVQYDADQSDQPWQLTHGPFDEDDFANLPNENWTLLVQSVNHYLPEAADLLRQFNFIPHARLDDLMVSYAAKGGSVGAHVDSYDVFLLQGAGKREWQIGEQARYQFLENAPIKVLPSFAAEQTFILEAGDMLYLPPNVAHHGIALDDDCMTYSIGFRAPNTEEVIPAFLHYLEGKSYKHQTYTDADLSVQAQPAAVSDDMVRKVSAAMQELTWDDADIAQFLAQYLSEPKPHVLFNRNPPLSLAAFSQQLSEQPIYLSLNSRLFFWQDHFYLNGELLVHTPPVIELLQTLGNTGKVFAGDEAEKLAECLLNEYQAGFCEFRD